MVRVTVLLYILQILGVSFCMSPRKPEEVTLDIVDPNKSSIDVLTRRPYGIHMEIYVARDGYGISSIVENQESVWKLTSGSSCNHVVVVLDRGDTPDSVAVQVEDKHGVKSFKYYEKKDRWTEVTEECFFKRFDNRVLRELVLESITVDINEDRTSKTLFKSKSGKLPFLVYAPNVGYRIERLTDKRCIIWETKLESERCIHISLYPRDDPTLGYLVVQNQDGLEELFFEKVVELWIDIDREKYLEDLVKAGFDKSTFNDNVTLDFTSVDKDVFYTNEIEIGDGSMKGHSSRPGFRMTKITEGSKIVWEGSSGEVCPYFRLIGIGDGTRLGLIFVSNAKMDKILYYREDSGNWKEVKREEYYRFHSDKNDPMYTHKGDGKVIMSSFRNKQGLRLVSYASRVANAKGDVILIHGIRSHFKSEFFASSAEWNFEHYGTPTSPHKVPFGDYHGIHEKSLISRYKYIFEHASFDGLNAFEVSPRYGYDYSLVEILNRFGYNVYGFDNQSQGLSESVAVTKCYVNDFKDHVHDVIQFVSIVKRGKFEDSSEKWNEDLVYKNIPTDKKTFLHGHSMGGNIVFQAVQEFYKNAEKGTKFVDGLIGTSAMLSLENRVDTTFKRVTKPFLGLLAWAVPEVGNPYESNNNYGSFLETFIRYNDPFYYGKRLAFKTIYSLFTACTEVNKDENIANYPKDLPTLLIHSKDDYICGVKGSKDMAEQHLKDSNVVQFVELGGTFHYLTLPQAMVFVESHLKKWFEKHG
ncbi:conserved hypothetical protein [Theileria equi strain WA]|uniref:Serine aminopeptidase S33 domain-containing protein n=1 Tax=Theileria equi strain WA TaxID=1537102 RepID=L1L948_THEEQ|nr:conserved hypothetical protein [Theileria equi strain WA]EKX72031.1 conserved hypothetical protein [Theileria equi strain WA]|eukprot:XP_004831483.1 conserved hypothetical protein [Theileria equi strain WA]